MSNEICKYLTVKGTYDPNPNLDTTFGQCSIRNRGFCPGFKQPAQDIIISRCPDKVEPTVPRFSRLFRHKI